ncbi:MAG: hypothetical protein JO061_00080 [Acidobacteriaceae bacterium]|nr:hypothetical protein [Acidobacteriaceae bacterium]
MNKIVLYLAIGYTGGAAYIGQATAGVPVPDMDEQTLQQKYHIAPTEQGLIGALQHQEAVVRSFAATKLANDGDKAAIRPILDALATEKLEGNKIILASAAARLGADEGFEALKSMCGDRSWSPTLRMTAAQTMVNVVGRQECLSDILDVLRWEPEDHQASFAALNLFAYNRFKQIPPSQLDEIRDVCAMHLKSQDAGLRIAAGMCIRDQGGPWAISQLRLALDAERDTAVRDSIAKDLLSVRP